VNSAGLVVTVTSGVHNFRLIAKPVQLVARRWLLERLMPVFVSRVPLVPTQLLVPLFVTNVPQVVILPFRTLVIA
jgi:hypothetical protein